MQRTQIYLEPDLTDSLDLLARQRGTSRAEVIREAAREYIARANVPGEDSIFGIIGIGHDDATDVSERHDEYLVEAEIRSWRR